MALNINWYTNMFHYELDMSISTLNLDLDPNEYRNQELTIWADV